ncbi:MAG: MBL fold metallo-hydrolase [Candidatus Nanohaloarchaea archaeon]
MDIENLAETAEDFTGNVWRISGTETVLIDAGEGDCWQEIDELESLDKVVVTHSHHDHVDNLPKIVDRFSPGVYAYEPENLPVDAEEIEEGDTLELSGTDFEVIQTPGHRDDSICLYSREEKLLFTGDLVFPEGGFGRTDLKEGDRDLLIESIEKVAELEVDEFYPGHGEAVTQDAGRWIEKSLEQAKKREPKY